MQINIYSIAKKDKVYQAVEAELCMQCRQFGAEVHVYELLPNAVLKAQKISPAHAQAAYTATLAPYVKPHALNLALHPSGKSYDSYQFAKKIESYQVLQCFIGGAYGFEKGFLKLCECVSLSAMTMSHKIAKLMLCEQIYRALSILHAHPYHK